VNEIGGENVNRTNRMRICLLLVAAVALGTLLTGCSAGVSAGYGYPGDERYGHPYYPPRNAEYGYHNDQFAVLAHELDDRAARAHALAEHRAASYGPREQEFFGRIHRFSDEAADFHARYESGEIRSRGEVRENLSRLLQDARDTDQAIRQANVFPEVWEEWSGVIRVLQRMLDMVR
jgi:hypothetical protein